MTGTTHPNRGIHVGVKVDAAVCVGCGVCPESCPTDVFRMTSDNKAYAAYPEDCQACFLCVIDCPVGALALDLVRLPRDEIGPVFA